MRDSQSDLLRGKNAERKAMVRGSPVEGGGLLLGLLERVRGLEAQQLRDLAAVRVVLIVFHRFSMKNHGFSRFPKDFGKSGCRN